MRHACRPRHQARPCTPPSQQAQSSMALEATLVVQQCQSRLLDFSPAPNDPQEQLHLQEPHLSPMQPRPGKLQAALIRTAGIKPRPSPHGSQQPLHRPRTASRVRSFPEEPHLEACLAPPAPIHQLVLGPAILICPALVASRACLLATQIGRAHCQSGSILQSWERSVFMIPDPALRACIDVAGLSTLTICSTFKRALPVLL